MAAGLKANTRSKTGKGVSTRIGPSSVVPGNGEEFLYINETRRSSSHHHTMH